MVKAAKRPLSVVNLKSDFEINITNGPRNAVSMLIMPNDKQLTN
jgi:hypothetical protein